MGFSDDYLRQVILEQAVLLALAGFTVGLALSFFADAYIALETRLPVRITMGSATLVCLLTLGMCILAGWMAIRRVAVADPAELY
jgi:putative ABC transport system permease protein